MKELETWSQLVTAEQNAAVPEFQTLRRKMGDAALHYYDDTKGQAETFLAIHDQHPYGVLDEAQAGAYTGHILSRAAQGPDFVIYRVPNDLISLEAATFDAQDRHAELLQRVYKQVGKLLCDVKSGVVLPSLEVQDVAVDRANHTVVLIPPVHFKDGTNAPLHTCESVFIDSMHRTFEGALSSHVLDRLGDEVIAGTRS